MISKRKKCTKMNCKENKCWLYCWMSLWCAMMWSVDSLCLIFKLFTWITHWYYYTGYGPFTFISAIVLLSWHDDLECVPTEKECKCTMHKHCTSNQDLLLVLDGPTATTSLDDCLCSTKCKALGTILSVKLFV